MRVFFRTIVLLFCLLLTKQIFKQIFFDLFEFVPSVDRRRVQHLDQLDVVGLVELDVVVQIGVEPEELRPDGFAPSLGLINGPGGIRAPEIDDRSLGMALVTKEGLLY